MLARQQGHFTASIRVTSRSPICRCCCRSSQQAIVGGVGSPLGAIAGGFVIAFSELTITFAYKKVLFYLLPEGMAPTGLMQLLSTDYKIALSFVILVIVLLIRPTGLFGGKRCDQRKYQKAATVCGKRFC